MNHCRQCGTPTQGELCPHCAVWFSTKEPPVEDPYASMSMPAPRRRPIALIVGASVACLALVLGVVMFFVLRTTPVAASALPSPTSEVATPLVEPTQSPSPTATEPSPTQEPVVQASSSPSTEAAVAPSPSERALAQRFDNFYPLSRGDSGYVVNALQGLSRGAHLRRRRLWSSDGTLGETVAGPRRPRAHGRRG